MIDQRVLENKRSITLFIWRVLIKGYLLFCLYNEYFQIRDLLICLCEKVLKNEISNYLFI